MRSEGIARPRDLEATHLRVAAQGMTKEQVSRAARREHLVQRAANKTPDHDRQEHGRSSDASRVTHSYRESTTACVSVPDQLLPRTAKRTQQRVLESGGGGREPDIALYAIRTSRVYEGVVSQIHRLILDGDLKPGDKLPPERELVQRFEVGRSSIRDAIRILEVMGTVKVRQGGGTVVQDLSPQSLVSPLASMLRRRRALVEELMDLRRLLEPPLASRAATKRTAHDIERLEQTLIRQGEKVSRGEMGASEDAEFHKGIARAGGNRVVLSVLDILMDLLAETRVEELQVEGRARRSLAGHRRILRAIRRQDAIAAEAAMRSHIAKVEEIILEKL